MRRSLLVALAVAALVAPATASAQTSCERQQQNRVVGTIAGGGVGAVVGGAVAGKKNRAAGAILGAVGGALIGNQLSKPSPDCAHAYGFYDPKGAWHANAVAKANAAGYFDREGQWVEGPPQGYYDQRGAWAPADGSPDQTGYYDASGRWVPPRVNGYYDPNDRWVATPVRAEMPPPPPARRDDDRRYDRGGAHDLDIRADELRREIRARRERNVIRGETARILLDRVQLVSDREADIIDRRGRLDGDEQSRLQRQLDDVDADLADASRR